MLRSLTAAAQNAGALTGAPAHSAILSRDRKGADVERASWPAMPALLQAIFSESVAAALIFRMARQSLKQRTEPEAIHLNGDLVSKRSAADFFASPSAADLVRAQGVHRIGKPGQVRGFSDPDPKEAEWLARELRRWRCDGLTAVL
jgi:hypothetical protein